jgi:hypothetical protein
MRLVSARDRRQHHLGRGDREVGAMVLADAEEIDADLVGQHALGDDVADDLPHGTASAPSGPVVTSPKVSSPSSRSLMRGSYRSRGVARAALASLDRFENRHRKIYVETARSRSSIRSRTSATCRPRSGRRNSWARSRF